MPPAPQQHRFVILRDRLQLRVTGSDAERYLNGQCSNRLPVNDECLPACVTSAKGKLDAFIYISRRKNHFHIDTDAALAETFPARLERYIISDDVKIEDVSDAFTLVHFFDSPAPEFPSHRANRFGIMGWDALVSSNQLAALAKNHNKLSTEFVEALRIQYVIPKWGSELDHTILPPEAGLDQWAIDYHKGCYIGQEILSRIKSVGHVNRRLCLLFTGPHLSEPRLEPGTRLHCLDEGKEIGHITSSALSFTLQRPIALAYLKRGWTTPMTTLEARTPQGNPICQVIVSPLDNPKIEQP